MPSYERDVVADLGGIIVNHLQFARERIAESIQSDETTLRLYDEYLRSASRQA